MLCAGVLIAVDQRKVTSVQFRYWITTEKKVDYIPYENTLLFSQENNFVYAAFADSEWAMRTDGE